MDMINQKEYLKKYLGIGRAPGEKKKKKKLKGISNRVTIIDDDAETSISSILIEDDLQANEDAPQIVAIIDERPPSLRVDEKTKNPLWQPIGSVDSLIVSEQKQTISGFKIASKSNDKQFALPIDRPPLKKRDGSTSRKARSDDDSPPRKKVMNDLYRKIKIEDASPPRKKPGVDDSSSPRQPRIAIIDDNSPPRNPKDDDVSSPRKQRDDDNSPPRKLKDDDMSPPRKYKSNDTSPPRKRKNDDTSPPRKSRGTDSLPPRSYEDDMSPPRRSQKYENSPPRRSKSYDQSPQKRRKRSPSRKNKPTKSLDPSPSRRPQEDFDNKESIKKKDPSADKRVKKMDKTLDGKTAGLQDAQQLVEENKQLRQREDQLFKNLSKELTGENAETVFRDRKSGKVRNLEEEDERQKKKLEEEEKNKEKYSRWGRGLIQVENRDEKMKEELYEMSKPLARYADDEDLEKFLKEQEREGDPMLQYIRSKRRKKAEETGVPMKPEFEGNFMPNRFGIKPGHRWDGVERSNGYEKRWFEIQNAKTAQQEDVYKWSTEDM